MHGRIKVRTTEEQKAQKQKEQQKKLMMYRAGMKQILSTRKPDSYDVDALKTCTNILLLNPDIYTLWNYRKEAILMEKQKVTDNVDYEDTFAEFLENDLSLTEQCLLLNPKSYGSWHHRYWLLENHPKPNWKKEFDLCTKYLTMDDRNFHCWDYRRLIVNKVGISLSNEINFSTERINVNFSNYSSWHYRSTLKKLNTEGLSTELQLVENAVFTDPADSSAWFYLRWVLSNPDVNKENRMNLLSAFDQLSELEPDCKWILMAKCWLTGSLCFSDKNFIDNRRQFYRELTKIDPMRQGQYEDYLKLSETSDAKGDE